MKSDIGVYTKITQKNLILIHNDPEQHQLIQEAQIKLTYSPPKEGLII
jgi:hypothetical protein